jgi:hypothetical protein
MSVEKKFTTTSDRFLFFDYSLGYKFKTPIFYEFGKLNGKNAIRFYIHEEVESTRLIHKKVNQSNFKMYRAGGQTLHSVRRQREKCLEYVVRDLFKSYGFKVSLKPRLGIYHPDIMIRKDKVKVYLELKAYHQSYLCGDTEISQVLKYYREVEALDPTAKVGLITSGSLISPEESFLNNQETEPLEYVTSYYKNLIIPRSQMRSLDDSSRRDIYSHAAKKFKKNFKEGFPPVKVKFLSRKQVQTFPDYLSLTEEYDVLLINSNRLMSLLKLAKLSTSVRKLQLLREKGLEHLIINGKILKF